MSKEIDEKVVQMTFENKNFEKNVKQTNKTLDSLQDKLNETGGSAAGLTNIANACQTVKVKFDMLSSAVSAIFEDMIRGAIATGKQLVASLSTDQIVAGYEKYEAMQTSTQTILAATRKEGQTDAEALVVVNEQLEKLNRFADETSYSLSDMTDNVGKFTSQGIGLEESVVAMEGISTWAAQAGQTTTEAARAMYNLSQSLAVGSVKLMDWRSIENAHMATAEFKQLAIDTAIELGELNKNTKVTVETFNDTLSDGWFTKDVLMEVLTRYGSFANEIISWTDSLENDAIGVTMVKGWITDWQKGTITLEEFATNLGKDSSYVTELTETLKKLGVMDDAGNAIETLGQKAFDAAQSTKTFTEAMVATKDAVSTQWMGIFQTIFGDFLESKSLWSDLAEELYTIFAVPVANLKSIFKEWSELNEGGRSDLVVSLFNIIEGLKNAGEAIKEAFSDIFPPLTADTLANVVKGIKDLSEKIKTKDWTVLKNILSGILSIIKAAFGIIKATFKAISPLLNLIKDGIVFIFEKLSIGSKKLSDNLEKSDGLTGFFSVIQSFCTKTAEILRKYIPVIVSFLAKPIQAIKTLFASGGSGGGKAKTVLLSVVDFVVELFSKIGTLASKMSEGIPAVFDYIKEVAEKFNLGEIVGKIFSMETFENLYKIANWLMKLFVKFSVAMAIIKDSKIASNVGNFFKNLSDAAKSLSNGIKDWFSAAKKSMKMKTLSGFIKSLAIFIAAIGATLFLMSKIDTKSMIISIVSITVLFGAMAGLTYLLSKMDEKSIKKGMTAMRKLTTSMVIMGMALAAVAGVIAIFGKIGWKQSLISIGMFTVFLAYMAVASIVSKKIKMTSMLKLATSMVMLGLAMSMLVGPILLISMIDFKKAMIGLGTVAIALSGVAILAALFNKLKVSGIVKFIAIAFSLSAALLVLRPAMIGLADIKFSEIGEGLLVVAAALISIGILAKIFKTAAPVMIAMGVALLLIAGSVYILSAGLSMLADSITALASLLTSNSDALANAVTLIVDSLINVVEGLLTTLIEGLPKFVTLITDKVNESLVKIVAITLGGTADILANLATFLTDNFSNIVTVLTNLIGIVCEVLYNNADTIATTVIELVDQILLALEKHLPSILNSLWSILIAITDFLIDKVPDLTVRLNDLAIELVKRIPIILEGILNAILDAIVDIIYKLADLIRVKTAKINDALDYLIIAIIEAVLDALLHLTSMPLKIASAIAKWAANMAPTLVESFKKGFAPIKEVGTYLIDGLINGLKAGWSKLKDCVTDVGGKVVGWFKDIFNINSPSKVMKEIGAFLDEGLANGMIDGVKDVQKSAELLGDVTTSTIYDAIEYAIDNVDYGLDSEFTITPVMDLSEIQNGVKTANGILSDIDNGSMSMGYSNAKRASRAGNSQNSDYTNALHEIKKLLTETLDRTPEVNNEFNFSGEVDERVLANEVSAIILRQINKAKAATT